MFSPTSTNTYNNNTSTDGVVVTNTTSNSVNATNSNQHILQHHQQQQLYMQPTQQHSNMYNSQQLINNQSIVYNNMSANSASLHSNPYMQQQTHYGMHHGHHHSHLTTAPVDQLIAPIDLIYNNGTSSNIGHHHHLKCKYFNKIIIIF